MYLFTTYGIKCPLNLTGNYVPSYRHSSLLFTFPLHPSYPPIIRVDECHNSGNHNMKPHNCRLSTWLINCLLRHQKIFCRQRDPLKNNLHRRKELIPNVTFVIDGWSGHYDTEPFCFHQIWRTPRPTKRTSDKEIYSTEWPTKCNSPFVLKDCLLNLTYFVPNEAIHLDFFLYSISNLKEILIFFNNPGLFNEKSLYSNSQHKA